MLKKFSSSFIFKKTIKASLNKLKRKPIFKYKNLMRKKNFSAVFLNGLNIKLKTLKQKENIIWKSKKGIKWCSSRAYLKREKNRRNKKILCDKLESKKRISSQLESTIKLKLKKENSVEKIVKSWFKLKIKKFYIKSITNGKLGKPSNIFKYKSKSLEKKFNAKQIFKIKRTLIKLLENIFHKRKQSNFSRKIHDLYASLKKNVKESFKTSNNNKF